MIPFLFNENQFSFFVADHLLVFQLCINPKSDRSLLSCLKVTQCSTSEIGDVPLYNPCSLPIQVMTTGPLPVPSKCKSGLPQITGTCPGWWKQSFQLQLWSLVWFQVRATSCHLTSSKSAWKSTPKCTWMFWNSGRGRLSTSLLLFPGPLLSRDVVPVIRFGLVSYSGHLFLEGGILLLCRRIQSAYSKPTWKNESIFGWGLTHLQEIQLAY